MSKVVVPVGSEQQEGPVGGLTKVTKSEGGARAPLPTRLVELWPLALQGLSVETELDVGFRHVECKRDCLSTPPSTAMAFRQYAVTLLDGQ
jgi:hypothetical protein